MRGGRVEYDLTDLARRGVESLDGAEILGFQMVHSTVVELAGFDLLKAAIAVFTSKSYYRIVWWCRGPARCGRGRGE